LSTYLDQPTLTVVSRIPGASVHLEELDQTGLVAGAKIDLGSTPLREQRVRPGYYRITVVNGEGDFAEIVRMLDQPRHGYSFDVTLRPTDEVVSDMRLIPGGPARVGSGPPENSGYYERVLDLPPFLIDEHEVTNRQYRDFMQATGHPAPALWIDGYPEQAAELPVTGVSYYEARAYAEWAGKRLPTLFEWVRAVRGSEGVDDIDEVLGDASVNLEQSAPIPLSQTGEQRWRAALDLYLATVQPAAAPGYRQGEHGLFHALGNVEEWTDTMVLAPGSSGGFDAYRAFRVVRGGSWVHPRNPVALLGNFETPVKLRSHTLGFRCARSLKPDKEAD
jgi:formylglycine-generating enzyme required for sulfatase activity